MVSRFRRARQVRHLCSSRPEVLQAPVPELEIGREIILVPRHQPHAAAAPDSQRTVAIELDFVFPIWTLGQFRDWEALHRFNESNLLFCGTLS